VAVMGKQTMRRAARLAASQLQAKHRLERAERDRRLERLAFEVLTALGERDAAIAATEQRAGAALQAMITDESLTVAEAVRWCAGVATGRRRGYASWPVLLTVKGRRATRVTRKRFEHPEEWRPLSVEAGRERGSRRHRLSTAGAAAAHGYSK
jgi:hypothetical protein